MYGALVVMDTAHVYVIVANTSRVRQVVVIPLKLLLHAQAGNTQYVPAAFIVATVSNVVLVTDAPVM